MAAHPSEIRLLVRLLILALLSTILAGPLPEAGAEASTPAPGTIHTFAGGALGPLALDILSGPTGIAVVTTTIEGRTDIRVGTVFFSDTKNHRVKMLIPSELGSYEPLSGAKVINVAGSGIAGNQGDGGEAVKAKLSSPNGLALLGSSLYIADSGNNRIREVNLACVAASCGTIETVIGDGSASVLYGPTDVAVSGTATDITLAVADTYNDAVKVFRRSDGQFKEDKSSSISKGCSEFSGCLNNPRGVAYSASGQIFVSDSGNHRVVRVDGASLIPVAGTGFYGFSGDTGIATSLRLNTPIGIALEGTSLYIADSGNDRIRQVDLSKSPPIMTTRSHELNYASHCAAAQAPTSTATLCPTTKPHLRNPSDVGLGLEDQLFISDTDADLATGASPLGVGVLRKMASGASSVDVIGGSGLLPGCCADDYLPVRLARLKRPGAVAVYSNGTQTMTYIADTGNNRIVAVDHNDRGWTVAGKECGTHDSGFPENYPSGNLDRLSTLTVVDGATYTVSPPEPLGGKATVTVRDQKMDPTSANPFLDYVDPPPSPPPNCYANGRLLDIPVGDGRPATQGSLNQPWGIDVNQQTGELYIADTFNHRIRKVDPGDDGIVNGVEDGSITTVAGNGHPTRLTLPPSTGLAVGTKQTYLPTETVATSTTLNFPYGLAVDNYLGTSGSLGKVFIADTNNNAIRMLDTDSGMLDLLLGGIELTSYSSYGTASKCCSLPRGIAVGIDGMDLQKASLKGPEDFGQDGEAIYVSDSGNARVLKATAVGEDYGWTKQAVIFLQQSQVNNLGIPIAIRNPTGLTVDDWGCVNVADRDTNQALTMCPPPSPINVPSLRQFAGLKLIAGCDPGISASCLLQDRYNDAATMSGVIGINYYSLVAAGSGVVGDAQEGAKASSSPLNAPSSFFRSLFDGAETAVIADTGNNKIKVVRDPGAPCSPPTPPDESIVNLPQNIDLRDDDVENPVNPSGTVTVGGAKDVNRTSCSRAAKPPPHPINDGIIRARTVSSLPFVLSGSNLGASSEYNEPLGTRGGSFDRTSHYSSATYRTVWFTFQPTQSLTAVADTTGSSFSTCSAGYQPCTGMTLWQLASDPPQPSTCLIDLNPPETAFAGFSLRRIACTNTDNYSTRLQLNLVAGNHYFLQLGGLGGARGNFQLSIRPA